MRLPGARRMRRGLDQVRWAAGQALDPPGLILLYHRVARPGVDPWGIRVRPERFAEHLAVLRRRARPVPLAEFPPGGRAGRGRVALTFDDGYADNLHGALPLLESWGIPATIFVASGYVGQAGPFWWDELGQILLGDYPLPGTLRLELPGEPHEWTLGEAAHARPSGRPAWRVETDPDAGPRERLFLDLYWRLRLLPPPEREAVLSALRAWAGPAGVEDSAADPHNRPLTSGELAELAAHPLVEIGAHTVTHPPLGDLGPAAQRAEIVGSRTDLERLLGRPVTSFSLPYGSQGEQTEGLVREAGFRRACTSAGRAVRRGANALALPRISVGDWTGEEFAARLDHWLGG